MNKISQSNNLGTEYCPCGTGKDYMNCCGAFISNQQIPSTPEELMRSRYTAYNQINLDYISHTMKSPASDHFDTEDARQWAESVSWRGLEIIRTTHDTNKGIVEFRASYVIGDKKNVLYEISEFIFENGKWYYVDGIQPNKKIVGTVTEKIGRNQVCPCGSNKKYKKCCGMK